MKSTETSPRPAPSQPADPLVRSGLKPDTPVGVPLDFLQSLSSIAHRNLERRPPKLKLQKRKSQLAAAAETEAALATNAVASRETADLAYQVAELVMRRQDQVLQSGNPGAIAGLQSLDRTVRMFEHIYLLSTGANQASVST